LRRGRPPEDLGDFGGNGEHVPIRQRDLDPFEERTHPGRVTPGPAGYAHGIMQGARVVLDLEPDQQWGEVPSNALREHR